MKKNVLTILALILILILALAGCGTKASGEPTAASLSVETAAESLAPGLKESKLTATTWSSPNGATIHLTATPLGYVEGCIANFIVRLESDEVANIPCQWDGKAYTADAELNAADGLCYYVSLTAADGTITEVPVNTPAQPTDEALIDLAASLTSYCTVTIDDSVFADGKLTITSGTVQVQAPKITNEGESITCQEASLTMSLNGEALDQEKLTLAEGQTPGFYSLALSNLTFDVPDLENDHQLTLTLNITLSNGQTLSDIGSTFYYNDGSVMTAVG